MGWSSGWPPEIWSSNTRDPQSFTRAPRELSKRSLSHEPASGAPGSKQARKRLLVHLFFHQQLAYVNSSPAPRAARGLPAPRRWPYLMGALPEPGFPACPSTGPRKSALVVGGGRSLTPQSPGPLYLHFAPPSNEAACSRCWGGPATRTTWPAPNPSFVLVQWC